MTAKELAEILIQNPNSQVTVLVVGDWHLSTAIKDIKMSFDGKIIALVVDNPEQVSDL